LFRKFTGDLSDTDMNGNFREWKKKRASYDIWAKGKSMQRSKQSKGMLDAHKAQIKLTAANMGVSGRNKSLPGLKVRWENQ
jgi:hypothetical protein